MSSTTTETIAQTAVNLEKQGEKEIKQLAQEDADTTDSNLRYMAYARRLGTALRSASRYTAYTSDIGEAFRPIAHPLLVRGAYAISWTYLIGDVSYETYKAKVQGPSLKETEMGLSEGGRLGLIGVKRSIFQAVASMALPAFTIHSIVKYSVPLFKSAPPRIKAWGPTISGLAAVPALPYMFDHPVEWANDKLFDLVEDGLRERNLKGKGVGAKVEEVKREL